MGDEFYCVLKLVSGEEIFSLISTDECEDETVIILQNPVIMKTMMNQHGSFMKIKPWIENSDDDIYIIKLDKVITMTESKDKSLIDIYSKYINSDNIETYSSDGQVKVSTEMGYVNSVENARELLENIFKETKDSKES